MYDFEELRPATDALWAAIAGRLTRLGVEAPASLTRGPSPDALWTDSGLLLAQTCGYPLATALRGRVTVVATPCYRALGCQGASYRSAIVVRAAEPARTLAALRGRRCAVNDAASNSGMNLLRQAVAALPGRAPFFGEIVWTGAHAASIRAVAEGRADVAAIDCVTWAQLQRLRPNLTAGLRVLAWTAASPGLPLITGAGTDAPTLAALRQAIDEVAGDPALAAVRDALLLDGVAVFEPGAYDAVLAIGAGKEGLLF